MDMNNLRGVLGRLEQKDSALGDGGVTADEIYTAASIAPVTGEAIAVKELPSDMKMIGELFSQGYSEMDFKKMGLGAAYAAAVTAGLIPVAGALGRMGKGAIKPLIKTAKNTENFGALPTNVVNIPIRNTEIPKENKKLSDYSDIIEQGIKLDTADAYKNLFHADIEFAKGYGGELKSGSLKYGSEGIPPSLTDNELVNAQNEIKGLTQDYLKDLPDDLTVYRYGNLDNNAGVSSFTLDPNFNAESNLPWQKRLQSPMQTFKVKKEDILASPDINSFFGGGRKFDEQEVIINNDKVGALPSSKNKITAFHASPKQIVGDFKISSKDVGIHFAENPELAKNAAIKSSLDTPFAYDEMQPFQYTLDVEPENIVSINSEGGRFDFYDVLENLLEDKKISSSTFNETFDKIQDIENQVSDIGFEEMMQKQNQVFSQMLVDKENIQALKYFNTKDSGITWRDLENQNLSNNVEPDFSYMVLDPSIIKKDK